MGFSSKTPDSASLPMAGLVWPANAHHRSNVDRLIPTAQYDLCKHGQLIAPTVESIFDLAPQSEAPARHQSTERDSIGQQIPKRHNWLNEFNLPVRELLLKL